MKNKKILFLYQLSQDLDVLLPAMKHTIQQGFQIKIVIKHGLFKTSPRTQCLNEFDTEIVELPKKYRRFQLFKTLKGCDVLVTASETNVEPHRMAHQMATIANFLFKKTITLQHGYENIGLTYSDKEYPIGKIKFASKFILTWSQELHKNIPIKTQRKCVPAGISKAQDNYMWPETFKANDYIAIFENLHWGRFSESYRQMFIELIEKVSLTFPNYFILIKPHHAGKWLTSRYKGTKPISPNIIIMDPDSPVWEPFTAPAVINHARLVISTPSSVCVDAYLQKKPIAVLKFDLELSNYNFTVKCETIDDVLSFISTPHLPPTYSNVILDHDNFLETFIKVIKN